MHLAAQPRLTLSKTTADNMILKCGWLSKLSVSAWLFKNWRRRFLTLCPDKLMWHTSEPGSGVFRGQVLTIRSDHCGLPNGMHSLLPLATVAPELRHVGTC